MSTEQVVEQARSFRYEAQTSSEQTLSGTIRAADAAGAQQALRDLGLTVIEIEPADEAPRRGALRGADFATFNHQLAQLTAAGLPVEQGLRLIARDMRRGRIAAAVNAVAEELESGTPLAEAFEKHKASFPALYGRIVQAGVRASNLPGVLFNLGRHVELMQRLRLTLWRASAYPLVLLVGIVLVIALLGVFIVPQFREIFDEFDTQLPAITAAVFAVADAMGAIIIAAALLLGALAVAGAAARSLGHGPWVVDHLVIPLPVIGSIVHRNLIARWIDALRLGVEAGLDLPAAFELAADAVASPRLRGETDRVLAELRAGRSIGKVQGLRLMPATVPAAIELASQRYDLPGMLENLSQIYQQQAEVRLANVQALLTPAFLLLIALIVGTVIVALLLPLSQLMMSVM